MTCIYKLVRLFVFSVIMHAAERAELKLLAVRDEKDKPMSGHGYQNIFVHQVILYHLHYDISDVRPSFKHSDLSRDDSVNKIEILFV